jgi:putative transposase
MAIIHKKRVRLKGFDYKGFFRYFVTICTYNKEWVFKNDLLLVEWLIDILREKSNAFGFKVWVYCFMPDHLHLLIEGKDNNSDMRRFISSYKQSTGFSYKKKTGQQLWQINYYEHVLRREEDTMNVVRYILNNPVRKELVVDFRKYKSLGSFEFDLLTL